MLSFKRFAAYLAKGVLPEMTALDEALAEHDKKYHGGHYDPETMSCGRRDTMAEEDKSDRIQDGGGMFADADGNAIAMQINENANHPHEKPSYVDRPRYEDVPPVPESTFARNSPAQGVGIGIFNLNEALVKVGDRYTTIPSTGMLDIKRNMKDGTVEVARESISLKLSGRRFEGDNRSDKAFNDMLLAVKKASDDGKIMPSLKCEYTEDEKGQGKLVFRERGKDNVDSDGKGKNGIAVVDDAAYLDAVEKGDLETAQRMVRDAAAKAMPDTKVVDEDGLPKVVYHTGTFGEKHTVPEIGREGMHFGTKQAADDRKGSKLAEELRARQHVGAFRASDGLWYYTTDKFGPHEYNSYEAGAEGWESAEEAMKAGEESLELEAENSSQGDYGFSTTSVFLNITNPYKNRDEGTYWGGVVRRSKESGNDGIEYENMFEDRGSRSYIAFQPSQIKSADAVTYDDAGKPIPLSRRFDFSSDDIRY